MEEECQHCVWCQMASIQVVHSSTHPATHCSTLQHTSTHFNALQRTPTHVLLQMKRSASAACGVRWHLLSCKTSVLTLQHTATHCNTLQHTATHSNTRVVADSIGVPALRVASDGIYSAVTQQLSHCNTATDCNTLKHTASHCNTLQHTCYCRWKRRVRCLLWQMASIQPSHSSTAAHSHCNTVQHSATHCNIVQHSATHMLL